MEFYQQLGSCDHLNNLVETSGWHSKEVTYEVDIADVCRAECVAQFGASECSNVCQPAHCYFLEEYECDELELGHLDCTDYLEGEVLYPAARTKKLFLMAKHIDEVCSKDLVNTARGRDACQQLCKFQLCCFDDGRECSRDPFGFVWHTTESAIKNCTSASACDL